MAMVEQGAQGVMAGQPLWPWPRHSAWPLEPGPYSPSGLDVETGVLSGLDVGAGALSGLDMGAGAPSLG